MRRETQDLVEANTAPELAEEILDLQGQVEEYENQIDDLNDKVETLEAELEDARLNE